MAISIIALLIAILLPALGSARDAARLVLCQSNQRQIGLGVAVYLQEHDDVFPSSDNPTGGSDGSVMWKGRIHKTMGLPIDPISTLLPANFESSVWACPSIESPTRDTVNKGYQVAFANLNATYGLLNTTGGRPFQEIEVNPSSLMLIRENRTVNNRGNDAFWYFPGNVDQLELPTRHGDNQNILFVDGHVETFENNWQSVIGWRWGFRIDKGVVRP